MKERLGKIEVTGRWGKTHKPLLDDLKEKRGSGTIQRRRNTPHCVEKTGLSHDGVENEWICRLFALSFDWIQACNPICVSKASIYVSTKVISPFDNHSSHFDQVSPSLLFLHNFFTRDINSPCLPICWHHTECGYDPWFIPVLRANWMGERNVLIDIGIISSTVFNI